MSMPTVTPLGKAALTAVAITALIFGAKSAMQHGIIPTPGVLSSVLATKVTADLTNQTDAVATVSTKLPFPSTRPANVHAPLFNLMGWEWGAQNGVFFAMGGPTTTQGSLDQKFGVNASFTRVDSNDLMKQRILKCADQLFHGATECTGDANVAYIAMGDSGGQWLADLNKQLETAYKTPAYDIKIVGAVGRSNGEDALLGPAEWKDNPKLMIGKTIVGVVLDGDWNIALAFMGFNNLKNNPDLHTYDPTAVNWISAPENDYIKAVTEVYIPNKCETRRVVIDGKPATVGGKSEVQVCPDGVVTWTPGDEQAVHGRDGTVKIISSHEYSAQMPASLFVIDKFAKSNPDVIAGFLAAEFTAADQLKSHPDALYYAAGIAAKVYADNDAKYWNTYAVGIRDKKTGTPLGGSAVFNLEDNLQFFGLKDGFQNNMKATYETFARIDAEQYPDQFKKSPIPPYSAAVTPTYIRLAQDKLSGEGIQGGAAETVDYTKDVAQGAVVSKSAIYISFATGSAALTPEGKVQLAQLASSLGIAKSLAFEIDGYTDNTGSDTVNIPLSESRALAVKTYLQTLAGRDFPNSRFKAVKGLGSQNPLVPNDTASDKAKNRRVEILQLGTDF